MKDGWKQLSLTNNRSGLFFWLVAAVLLAPLIQIAQWEYSSYLSYAILATTIIGAPIHMIWIFFSAYEQTKKSPNYLRIRFIIGMVIMSLIAFAWIGLLIIFLTASTAARIGFPVGMFLVPALIIGAVSEQLIKSAFYSDKMTSSPPV